MNDLNTLTEDKKVVLRTELREILRKIREAQDVLARSYSQSNCCEMMARSFARRDLGRLETRYKEIRKLAIGY